MKDTSDRPDVKQHYYLWHLSALGVLDMEEDGSIAATLWDKIAEKGEVSPATVVMIDVGCDFDHPNLKGRVDPKASIDFTAGAGGARLKSIAGEEPACHFSDLDIEKLRLDGLAPDDLKLFGEVVEHLKPLPEQIRTAGDPDAMFASHGTAVAGLVVGGPEALGGPDPDPTPGVIPYFGADPFSLLVSVRTGFEDAPLQFIAALLYAWAQSPDVIVLPRGLPDPEENEVEPKDDFQAELESWASREAADLLDRIEIMRESASPMAPKRPQRSLTDRRLWRIVRALLVAISKHVPFVCAAGNEGESQLLYPASLATRENGIIAVGAVSGEGYRSGYANYGEGLTLVAPSDDMAVFNRHQHRDKAETAEKQKHLRPPDAQEAPYSEKALLSTDIAGNFGYDLGTGPADREGKGGYYTQFGGTSGAAALVAGVIALVRRAERASNPKAQIKDGVDISNLLTECARLKLSVDGKEIDLQPDSMNAETEVAEDPRVFFGAGLINARAAVEKVLV